MLTESQSFTAELLERRWVSESTFEIELSRPRNFSFVPGQRMRLALGTGSRDYSLISSPKDSTIAFYIRRVKDGRISPLLAQAEAGTPIECSGPCGYFTFRPSPRPAIFVATGTGIAPFVSMGRSGLSDFTLLHGVRKHTDLFCRSLFIAAAQKYVPCISGTPLEQGHDFQDVFHGRVTQYIKRHLVPGIYDFYLCGSSEMIRSATLLMDDLFPGSLVYTEIFF